MTISRQALFSSLLIALWQTSPVAANIPHSEPPSALRSALAAAQNNDCKTALSIVVQQTSAPDFAKLPAQAKLVYYQLGLGCAAEAGQMDQALRYAEAGTKVADGTPELWHARLELTWYGKHDAEAVAAAEGMAQINPDALNTMPMTIWFSMDRRLKSEPDLRRRLLRVLVAPSYVPSQVGSSTDYFRQQYAAILVDAGDKAGAASMVTLISEPKILMRLSVDPRLRDLVPADFDARVAIERHIAQMKEVAEAHSSVIRPRLNIAEDLLTLGNGQDAIAALDAIRPDTADANAYSDKEDTLNWWWDAKARAFAVLGQHDQAIAAYSRGKSTDEQGHPNVSQTINMSELLLSFGKSAEALATLAPFSSGITGVSPYGWMQFRADHGCASFKQGMTADAKADLAYLQDHFTDAPNAVTSLQLCMGNIDGAAASIIKRLEMPDQQAETLLDLSDFAPNPPAYSLFPGEDAYPVLKSRADVEAAVARAGGTRRFDVPSLMLTR